MSKNDHEVKNVLKQLAGKFEELNHALKHETGKGIQTLYGDKFINDQEVLTEFKLFQKYRNEIMDFMKEKYPEELI